MRKNLAIILVICLVVTVVSVSASAEPRVTLEVTETDGSIKAQLKVYNTTFQGVEAVIAYNPLYVTPEEDTIRANFGHNIMTCVEASHNAEQGTITVAGITNINQSVPNELVSEDYKISADENGISVAEIAFSKIKDGNNGISFAVTDGLCNVILAENGKTLSFTAEVKNDSFDAVIVCKVKGNAETEEEARLRKRQERLKDTTILQIGNYAVSREGNLNHIDPENKKVFPFTQNDRTLVPLRFIAESLGLSVSWDEQTETVTLTKDEINLTFVINKDTYTKNGEEFMLDSPPVLHESRTFVPLRAISEGFDMDVCWIESFSVVVISPKDMPWDVNNAIEQELLNDTMIILSPFVRDMI